MEAEGVCIAGPLEYGSEVVEAFSSSGRMLLLVLCVVAVGEVLEELALSWDVSIMFEIAIPAVL